MATEAAVPRAAAHADRRLVPSGHELVAMTESFAARATAIALVFIGGAAAVSLALLAVRADDVATAIPGAAACVATIAACVVLVRRAPVLFVALRSDVRAQAALIAWATAMVAVIPPLRSELWFISLGCLCLLALATTLGRALAACAVVLLTNLAAHVIVGDLDEIDAVVIGGLWIGMPFWTVAISTTMERLSRHLLQLHRHHPGLAPGDADGGASTPPGDDEVDDREVPGGDPPAQDDRRSSVDGDGPRAKDRLPSDAPALRPLTSRQLQVLLLLVDGYQQTQIAVRLGISERTVQRHAADARERLGARTTAELVTLAIRDGIAPTPSARAEAILPPTDTAGALGSPEGDDGAGGVVPGR